MAAASLKESSRNLRERGFTLIEFGIVIIIGGLMISGALGVYVDYLKKYKFEVSFKRLYETNAMLAQTWKVGNRYFCPADPTLAPGNADYGIENCATSVAVGSCTGGTEGVCVSAGRTATGTQTRVLTGMIPFRSITSALGANRRELERQMTQAKDPAVKEEIRAALDHAKKAMMLDAKNMAFDGWGNQFTYMVSAAWTVEMSEADPVLRGSGSIEVVDAEGKAATKKGAHFAIISHGVNGNGAYDQLGKRPHDCTGLSAAEQENCDGDATVMRAAVQSRGSNSRLTDDLVAYSNSASNELWERVACGSDGQELCLRNRNAANVTIGTTTAASEKLTVGGLMRAQNLSLSAKLDDGEPPICDADGGNCISPEYIGGDRLNDCSVLNNPATPNKQWVARRIGRKIENGIEVPNLECVEITMKTYGQTCPDKWLLRGIVDSEIKCFDPCAGSETSESNTVTCPTGMTGNQTYENYYTCTTRSWEDFDTVDTCAFVPINGTCGLLNGKNLNYDSGVVPTENLCLNGPEGTATATAGGWTWTCAGQHGGTNASCSATNANAVANGICGSAHNSTTSTKPTSNLCAVGTNTTVSGSGPWTWTCAGINGGDSSGTCKANKPAPPTPPSAVCGTLHGTAIPGGTTPPPDSDPGHCSIGSMSGRSFSSKIEWYCSEPGYTTVSCFLYNGACGASNKKDFGTAPGYAPATVFSNKCNGNMSAPEVTHIGNGDIRWTCTVGSVSENCQAHSGSCHYGGGTRFATMPPDSDLCIYGTPVGKNVVEYPTYTGLSYQCLGNYGGYIGSCSIWIDK